MGYGEESRFLTKPWIGADSQDESSRRGRGEVEEVEIAAFEKGLGDFIDYGGDDCDDEDETINIDATEIWYDGVDQDCDTLSDYDADYDGQDSESYGGEDCDDADPNTYAGAPDTPYDGIITDCLNANDYDADGDGVLAEEYGGTDCDDANSEVNPGAEEIWYDGIDQDCDGNDDDQDGDGVPMSEDCDDEDPCTVDSCSVEDDGQCNHVPLMCAPTQHTPCALPQWSISFSLSPLAIERVVTQSVPSTQG